MPYEVSRGEVWAGEVSDYPGALAEKLEALTRAGVDLESAVARPAAPLSNVSVLFLSPVVGPEQQAAAREAGLHPTRSVHTVRITGPDRLGLVGQIARILADEGLHVCGFSSTALETRTVHHFRFPSPGEAERGEAVLREKLK